MADRINGARFFLLLPAGRRGRSLWRLTRFGLLRYKIPMIELHQLTKRYGTFTRWTT